MQGGVGPGPGLAVEAGGASGVAQALGVEAGHPLPHPGHGASVLGEEADGGVGDAGAGPQEEDSKPRHRGEGEALLVVDPDAPGLPLHHGVLHVEVGEAVPELGKLLEVPGAGNGGHAASLGGHGKEAEAQGLPGAHAPP